MFDQKYDNNNGMLSIENYFILRKHKKHERVLYKNCCHINQQLTSTRSKCIRYLHTALLFLGWQRMDVVYADQSPQCLLCVSTLDGHFSRINLLSDIVSMFCQQQQNLLHTIFLFVFTITRCFSRYLLLLSTTIISQTQTSYYLLSIV